MRHALGMLICRVLLAGLRAAFWVREKVKP